MRWIMYTIIFLGPGLYIPGPSDFKTSEVQKSETKQVTKTDDPHTREELKLR